MREQIVGAAGGVLACRCGGLFREMTVSVKSVGASCPKCFLEPGFEFSKVIPSEFFRIAAPESVVKQHFFENGLFSMASFELGLNHTQARRVAAVDHGACAQHSPGTVRGTAGFARIQYLLAF